MSKSWHYNLAHKNNLCLAFLKTKYLSGNMGLCLGLKPVRIFKSYVPPINGNHTRYHRGRATENDRVAFGLHLKWGPTITFTQEPTSKRKSLKPLTSKCLRAIPALASTLPNFVSVGCLVRQDSDTSGQARKFEPKTLIHCPSKERLSARRLSPQILFVGEEISGLCLWTFWELPQK